MPLVGLIATTSHASNQRMEEKTQAARGIQAGAHKPWRQSQQRRRRCRRPVSRRSSGKIFPMADPCTGSWGLRLLRHFAKD